jgi:hypothetical protein
LLEVSHDQANKNRASEATRHAIVETVRGLHKIGIANGQELTTTTPIKMKQRAHADGVENPTAPHRNSTAIRPAIRHSL